MPAFRSLSARIALAAFVCAALFALALLSGCSAEDPASKLVGEWSAPATADKPANLSDLTLKADKTFVHVGKNALGGKVTFMGVYETGTSKEGPWVRLVYHDFPDRQVAWFYKIEGDKLYVSSLVGNLSNGTALEFTRK